MMKLLRFVLMACLSLVAFSCSRLDGGADVSGTPDGAAVKVDSPLMSDRFAESMVAYTVKDLRNGTVSPVKVQHSQSGMLYFPVSEDNGGAVVVAGGFPEITSSQKDGKLLVMSLGKAGVYSEFPDPNSNPGLCFNGEIIYPEIKIQRNRFTFIIGKSGCGKSTYLKMLNRMVLPNEGSIRYNGKEISEYPVLEYRRNVLLVPFFRLRQIFPWLYSV